VNTGIGDPAAIARAIREIEQSEDERSGRLIQTIR
jgi:hypothetical protein